MKKLFYAFAPALATLAACNTPLTSPGNEATSTPVASATGAESCGLAAGTLVDEKALYGAEVAYNVPANAYVTLDTNGQLNADLKAKVKPLLVGAYNALGVARSAYKFGDVCTFFGAVKTVTDFTTKAKVLLPHRE